MKSQRININKTRVKTWTRMRNKMSRSWVGNGYDEAYIHLSTYVIRGDNINMRDAICSKANENGKT